MEAIEQFLEWVKESDNIVFFGGAGVSTESGIPDFRSVDGLYNQQYDYPPETILSHTFYRSNPEEFYRFYRNKMLCLDAEPNVTHKKLAELEKAGKLKGIVTQNIDGLHQKAGSKNVMELHGSVLRNYCEHCNEFVPAEDILHSEGVPVCPACGGPVKPDVVLYEEGLNQTTLQDAVYYISHADMLIVGGTSLAVYPAAGLIDYYRGSRLVLVNKSATPRDRQADLLIQDGLGNVFSKIEV
ncbi:MAG: NAD-dependent protein deacylase [Muribaculaceae bacterium]|nr:NAD-dependent protein deacylase [Roseburia sp.]MCM1431711.1 NAD-dependent protein deacylase [Muribaculaceae bacterium]MCM1491617.1 NAD-dependent protein deacylase [Muribaculaceae bacterium]